MDSIPWSKDRYLVYPCVCVAGVGGGVILNVYGFLGKGSYWDKVNATKCVYKYGLEFLTIQKTDIRGVFVGAFFSLVLRQILAPLPMKLIPQ